jgi:serine/threonine protein kinase
MATPIMHIKGSLTVCVDVDTDPSSASVSFEHSDKMRRSGRLSSTRPELAEVPQTDIERLGSFCNVYAIKIRNRLDCDVFGLDGENSSRRTYAAKMLRLDPTGSSRQVQAAKDLAEEAALLSGLPCHDNIIALRAVSVQFFEDPSKGFLVLDRLAETLQDVLRRWRSDAEQGAGVGMNDQSRRVSLFCFHRANARRIPSVSRETLRGTDVGIPLARAMAFLHQHNVIFRDISPANIGFEESGTLKLFDFGTARRYQPGREATTFTGTPRYMSPEVMAGMSYDLSVDVYSFAVVLWEVSTKTLQRPYALFRDLSSAKRSIVGMQHRPPLHHISNKRLRRLIKAGWEPTPEKRPTVSSIVAELESIRNAVHAP